MLAAARRAGLAQPAVPDSLWPDALTLWLPYAVSASRAPRSAPLREAWRAAAIASAPIALCLVPLLSTRRPDAIRQATEGLADVVVGPAVRATIAIVVDAADAPTAGPRPPPFWRDAAFSAPGAVTSVAVFEEALVERLLVWAFEEGGMSAAVGPHRPWRETVVFRPATDSARDDHAGE